MIFKLTPIVPWTGEFEIVHEFIVRASSELHARELASENSGYEGSNVWLDTTKTKCEPLDPNGPPEILHCEWYAA